MNNYFAFIDESGNSNQERYFGLGLLLINDEIGRVFDELKPFYTQISEISKAQKLQRIQILKENNDLDQLVQLASSTKRFELKFKYVSNLNNATYMSMIEKYFSFSSLRFCALVMDRQEIGSTFDPWKAYIFRASTLLSNNIKRLTPCHICDLADDLTKPNTVKKTFEEALSESIRSNLQKDKVTASSTVFGVARLESHASFFTQMVDVLLGCVMYDFKKNAGLISEGLARKQEPVVTKVRQILKVDSLSGNKTVGIPNYFSVWQFHNKK